MHPHTTKLQQKLLKTERHPQITPNMTWQTAQLRELKQGNRSSVAAQEVHQKARKLQAVILTKCHSLLGMHAASVNQPAAAATAAMSGAPVNFHGYPGTLPVILFHPAWRGDLVGGIHC